MAQSVTMDQTTSVWLPTGADNFLFTTNDIPTLGPNQWVPGPFCLSEANWNVKLITHFHPVLIYRVQRALSSHSQCFQSVMFKAQGPYYLYSKDKDIEKAHLKRWNNTCNRPSKPTAEFKLFQYFFLSLVWGCPHPVVICSCLVLAPDCHFEFWHLET